eukprot:5098254-Lingulodinium_polyedra.AAC.1
MAIEFANDASIPPGPTTIVGAAWGLPDIAPTPGVCATRSCTASSTAPWRALRAALGSSVGSRCGG